MQILNLLDAPEFHDKDPYAQPLHVTSTGRALRYTFRPGQSVREHSVPNSPVYIVVLKGTGVFTGGEGVEQTFGPNAFLTFEPGEEHAIRATNEDLVLLVILREAPMYGSGEGQSSKPEDKISHLSQPIQKDS